MEGFEPGEEFEVAGFGVGEAAPGGAAGLGGRGGHGELRLAVGTNRVSFLLVRDDNSLVRAPVADVYYRPHPSGPTRRAVARLVPIGTKASAQEADDVKEIYLANLRLPRTGKQWIVVQPRGVAFQGFQILDVKEEPAAVAIGERAPASNTPTTATRPPATHWRAARSRASIRLPSSATPWRAMSNAVP